MQSSNRCGGLLNGGAGGTKLGYLIFLFFRSDGPGFESLRIQVCFGPRRSTSSKFGNTLVSTFRRYVNAAPPWTCILSKDQRALGVIACLLGHILGLGVSVRECGHLRL
jgi:hypothetical protein